MSFGFGVSDFVAVGTLAWKVYKNVYKAAKDTPESFQKVHLDVLSLHAVLKEAGETIFKSPIMLVTKYEKMGIQGKWTWERFRWGSVDIQDLRSRITSSVIMLNAFMSTSQAITQQKLEKYLLEVQLRKREGSIVSVQTVGSLSGEDRAAWRAIRKDLESFGITAEAYDTNQEFIRGWLTRALDKGALDKQALPNDEQKETVEHELSLALTHPPFAPGSGGTCDADPKCVVSSNADSSGLDIPKANVRDRTSGITITNRPVSGVQALIAIVSLPKTRLLRLAQSPVQNYELSRLLERPATRRLIDSGTIDRAFLGACRWGHWTAVSRLLEQGASVNGTTVKSQTRVYAKRRAVSLIIGEGASGLMLAAIRGKRDIVRILLHWGAEVIPKWSFAVAGDDLDIVRMILDAGADINQSIDGRTALHEASNLRMFQELLEKGADIKQANGTPSWPISKRLWGAVHVFIEKGANVTRVMDLQNIDGHRTALEVARALKPWTADVDAVVDYLMKHGARNDSHSQRSLH
ncbi:MAG: hypothetical protein Q9209_004290 [Squamulea sp. 1 TL-2023]